MPLKFPVKTTPQTQAAPAAPAAPASAVAPPARIASKPTAGSVFAGIENVQASFASNYMKDGSYFALVRQVKQSTSRKNIPFVAIEMTILCGLPNSENRMRDGEECSHLLMANNDSFLPNFKQFVAAVAECEADEVTAEICKEITSEVQPLAGMLIEVEARTILTKAQKDFTRVTYKRAVTATEVAKLIKPEIADLVFPKGELTTMVANESGQ